MRISRISPEELEQQASDQYRRFLGISDRPQQQAKPGKVVNAREAAAIDRPGAFTFRGREYVLPPISFEDGCDLHQIRKELFDAATGSTEAYREANRKAVRFMGRLARRKGIVGWLFNWRIPMPESDIRIRLLPNPFRNASETEIEVLLDFFWKCRTGLPFPVWLAAMNGRETSTSLAGSTHSARATVSGPGRGKITSTERRS